MSTALPISADQDLAASAVGDDLLAKAVQVAGASPSLAGGDFLDARIMVVDDEPVNISVVTKYLQDHGYHDFVSATDPLKCLKMMQAEQPDLILLDIMMPQQNGLDLLRMIRNEPQFVNLPVIILTAYCDASNRREALESGATDFLAKPVDPHELIPRVRNVLATKSHHDEVQQQVRRLEDDIQSKTEELVAMRHEAELRYFSGKAEIATEVLHNVGNALNSVNVAVDLVGYTLKESRLPALRRVADLMKEHDKKIGKFMQKDKRGQVLPSYIDELAETLLQEREVSLREIKSLGKHLEHIKAVVSTQQKYARLCNVMEPISLLELMRDGEELLGSSVVKRGVEVIFSHVDVPPVKTDKQKLLQVFVNVLKNAVESAGQHHPNGGGRVELRLGAEANGFVFIEIRDNGVGIPKESTAKIFAHGFTTKTNGSGFGLHSCANILKELGGSIHAESNGLGAGAVFRLEIPLKQEDKGGER